MSLKKALRFMQQCWQW